jgi:hypothetical protein
MLGHSNMHHPPALVGEDHQKEQQAARRGRHHEEIRGHHLPDVIRQERVPRLGRRAPRADHVFRDGRLTDVNAQFQQLTVDPGSAPERVGPRHRPNQRAHIGGHGWPTGPPAALPRPEQAEAAAVPGEDCLRFDDDQCGLPVFQTRASHTHRRRSAAVSRSRGDRAR